MEYRTEILLKKDNEWYWLGTGTGYEDDHISILGSFNLTKDKSQADLLFANDINVWMPTPQSWIEPIEALRRHSLESNYWVEFRRNPHKLGLGIHELMVVNNSNA